MISHFSAEELASYRAGEIGADRAARISAHLADCPRCAGVDSDLAGVSALLASMPVPSMPNRLTERVSAAIAAEAEQRAAGFGGVLAGQQASSDGSDVGLDDGLSAVPARTGGPASVPGRPDLPERSRRRRAGSRRSIWTSPLVIGGLAATGVFAFVVIGAAIALNHQSAGPASASGSRSAAAGGVPKAARRPTPNAHAPFGFNTPVYAAAGVSVKYHAAGRKRTTTVYASAARYDRGSIGRLVGSGAVGATSAPAYGGPDNHGEPTAKPSRKVGQVSVGQVEGCLSAVAPSNGVLLVEIAHYQGKPAMIIVSTAVAHAHQITVAGLACSASRPDVLAKITVPEHR